MKTPQSCRQARLAAPHRGRAMAFMLSVLLLTVGYAPAQTAKGRPLKLKITALAKHTHVGDKMEIAISCVDAENEAAPAPRDYTIQLTVQWPSGRIDSLAVLINSGETTGRTTVVAQEAGLLHLQAQHERLQEGGTFVNVKPVGRRTRSAEPEAAAQTAPSRAPASEVQARHSERDMPVNARESTSALSLKPTITLRYSPQRSLLADGKDGATIQAFLLDEDDSLGQAIQVQLFSSSGMLQPQLLLIPAGESSGAATLTSQDVQAVTVEYVSSKPPAIIEGDKKLQIQFGPAIAQIVLDPSPAQITLVDECDLNVKLLDAQGRAINTDIPRTVSFEIDHGRGDIEKKEIVIPAGSFRGSTIFRPTWRGELALSAATPNLPASSASLKVSLPFVLLTLTALGGIAGGFIAYWREQNAKWWRIVIGFITGFLLYWGFVFNVLPFVPHNVALNPLSGLAISIVGGWLGTEVFSIILKKFGIGTSSSGS